MVTFISCSLVTLAIFLAIPVAVFFAEIVAAITLPKRDCSVPTIKGSRGSVAILIPAHNEGAGLLPTLADIKAQIGEADRVLVVADNCSDDTASVAAAAGVGVVDRNDPDRKGKGYALAYGLHHLRIDPPDVVIIIDADCRLAKDAIVRLATACAVTGRPVQALYLMIAPSDSQINYRVTEFAWRVKNWVRPLGLRALGLPCQLMGTGMAFPWEVIRSVDLASGSIVEDLKLGFDLALAGNPPVFLPSACVTSDFPSSVEGRQTQRRRWEQGHIGMIRTAAPRLILAGIARADFGLLALALDVAVPPLSLLGMLMIVMSVVAGLATLLGLSSAAMSVCTLSLMAFIGGVFLSWSKYGRDILPAGAILSIASYVIGKVPLYRQILSRKPGWQWIRTDRRKV